jgi:hypothetical protein
MRRMIFAEWGVLGFFTRGTLILPQLNSLRLVTAANSARE